MGHGIVSIAVYGKQGIGQVVAQHLRRIALLLQFFWCFDAAYDSHGFMAFFPKEINQHRHQDQ